MLQLVILASALVGIALLLLGINIFVFGRKFPETEVGKNKHMIKLGLRCPHCEERARYHKPRRPGLDVKTLVPDWDAMRV